MSEPGLTVDFERKQKEARKRLWAVGELSWKFRERPWQRRMYDFIRSLWGVLIILLAHRRSGKSTCGLIIALEECLRKPNTPVAVVCNTILQATAICEESFVEVLADCPDSLHPTLIKKEMAYCFKNGSKLYILPAEGLTKKRLRGRRFRFIVITEGATIPRLRKLVSSVLAPTTRDVLGKETGTILIETTPPDPDEVPEEDVEIFEQMVAEAQLDNRAFILPLSQNPDADPGFVEQAKKDCGGIDSEEYQREYECRFGITKTSTAVPEFRPDRAFKGDEKRQLPPIVREVARPAGVDRYTGMDPGGTHPTALLWGFHHPTEDLLVIEDEEMMENPNSSTIAKRVSDKEKHLWGDQPDGKLRRFSDNDNVILLFDLIKEGVRFDATEKDNKRGWVNKLRLMVRDGRIAIHPRCKRLIKTMTLAKWHKNERKGFQEMQRELGHADLLDGLLYIVRNVRRAELPADFTVHQVQEGSNARVQMRDGFGTTRPERDLVSALRRRFVEY